MDSIAIAQKQLSRINSLPRKQPRRQNTVEKKAKSLKRARKAKDAPKPPTNEIPDVPGDTYTIEWELDEAAGLVETPPSKLITKKMIWDPATKDIVWTESTVTPISPPSKKKRSEVDKLLGDEGVQTIMRDQQIAVDDNGLLVNISKASKTRHQRSKQEEPEKTPNDWNDCSMIMRRRSSSFSVDSVQFTQPEVATTIIEKPAVTSPSMIVDYFQSVKANINQKLSANFDSVALNSSADQEPNNNSVSVKSLARKSPPKGKGKPPTAKGASKKIDRVAAKLPQVIQCPMDSVACEEIIAALEEKLKDESCKLVLFGPVKFTVQDDPTSRESQSVEERNLLAYLAKFPKPIFAAIQGKVEGVGVTMLPLFDMVFAKYGTEFCCAKDPLPGMSILMSSPKVDKNKISEMLFLGESITSTQAVSCGLITREIASKNDEDFGEKFGRIANEAVENNYTERIRVLKKLWADSHLKQLLKDLNRESSV